MITTFMVVNAQNEVDSNAFEIWCPTRSAVRYDYHSQLADEIELLDGASDEFDMEAVRHGKLSPVFFGSALTNFGVETFLKNFLQMTSSPLPRKTVTGVVDPFKEDFSAFVFKIQANMNKAHRDRIAFMRICSGKFERGYDVYHIQGGKKIRLRSHSSLWRRTVPLWTKPTQEIS